MSILRVAILSLALVATTPAEQAHAVPPVLAPKAALSLVDAYMKSVGDNDPVAYAKLFAPDATIVSDWPESMSRDAWLKSVSREFEPTRRTRFSAVYSRGAEDKGKRATRVLLVQEITNCRRGMAECFGQFRSETLIIQDGLIVALDRASFTHRLADGAWTFYAP